MRSWPPGREKTTLQQSIYRHDTYVIYSLRTLISFFHLSSLTTSCIPSQISSFILHPKMTSSIPKTMKAWQFSQTVGGLERNLTLNSSAALPSNAASLAADQTLVKVIAATINPVDYKFPEIPLVGRLVVGKPASPGIDYAGRVVATGPNSRKVSTQDLKAGQLVFGRLDSPTKFGTIAEYTIVPRQGCVPIPDGVSPQDAACVGTAGLTAYQSIVPFINSGQRIFINGGSGGTGVFGIQIAKAKGCSVVTSCSTPNVDLCKSLGADQVIDYKKQDLAAELTRLGKFDLVVDNVGQPSNLFWQAHSFLKAGAQWEQVGAGFSVSDMRELMSRMFWPRLLGGGNTKFQFIGVTSNYEDYKQIGQWMQEGKVKAITDEVYGMEDKGPVKAFERLRTGRAKGKVVVRVADE